MLNGATQPVDIYYKHAKNLSEIKHLCLLPMMIKLEAGGFLTTVIKKRLNINYTYGYDAESLNNILESKTGIRISVDVFVQLMEFLGYTTNRHNGKTWFNVKKNFAFDKYSFMWSNTDNPSSGDSVYLLGETDKPGCFAAEIHVIRKVDDIKVYISGGTAKESLVFDKKTGKSVNTQGLLFWLPNVFECFVKRNVLMELGVIEEFNGNLSISYNVSERSVETNVNDSIGVRIKNAREESGLSIGDLSELIEYSKPLICEWEKDNFTPSSEAIEALEKAFGDNLFDGLSIGRKK